MVLKAIDDGNAMIKTMAFACLGEMVRHLQPEVLVFHEQALPRILRHINDAEYAWLCSIVHIFKYIYAAYVSTMRHVRIFSLYRFIRRLLHVRVDSL